MSTFPCLVRCSTARGESRFRLGDPLVDSYLQFVAGRSRPNTLRAVAHDLKTFFAVVDKPPIEVVPADVFAFLADQRGDRRVVRLVLDDLLDSCGGRAATGVCAHTEKVDEVPVGAVGVGHLQVDQPDEMAFPPDALAEVEVVVSHHRRRIVYGPATGLQQFESAVHLGGAGVTDSGTNDVAEGVDELVPWDHGCAAEQARRLEVLRGCCVECSNSQGQLVRSGFPISERESGPHRVQRLAWYAFGDQPVVVPRAATRYHRGVERFGRQEGGDVRLVSKSPGGADDSWRTTASSVIHAECE